MDNTDNILEVSVINTALRSRAALVRLMEEDNIFFYPANRAIYDAMKSMYNASREVDVIGVYDYLQQNGGAGDFLEHYSAGNTSAFVGAHIDSLANLAKKRDIARATERISHAAQKRTTSLDAIIGDLEKTLRGVNAAKPVNYISAADIDPDELMTNEKAYATGFGDLDAVINGFYGGQLVILGARTRIGKSALALQIAAHISQTEHALFFSLEMPVKQIALRQLAMLTGLEMWKIRSNKLNDADKRVLFGAVDRIRAEYKRLVYVDNSYSLQSIMNNVRKYHDLYGKCFVVVDYLQLVSLPKQQNRYLEIGEVTRSLKLLAMELDIPVMGLSQLNRGSEGEVPRLSDLRESGNLEQDADLVMFIHRGNNENTCELIIAKNRDGATKSIDMWFDAPRMSFRGMV